MLNLASPWLIQPQQPVGIDWRNPLTRGLVAAPLPVGGGKMWDAVIGRLMTSVGSPVDVCNAKGRAIDTNGTSQYAWREISFPNSCNATLLAVSYDQSENNDARLLALGSSSTPTPIIAISRTTSSGVLYAFVRTDAGGGIIGTADLLGARIDDGSPHVIALRVENIAGAGSAVGFVDGKKGNTYTGTLGTTSVNRLAVNCLLRSTAGNYWKAPTNLALVWNRALSDSEAVSVTTNPWQIFEPLEEILVLPASGVPALVVADGTHAHTADSLALTAQSALAVQEALHAHVAGNLTLTLNTATSLIIADGTHGHTADSPALTAQSALAVQEALHAHVADSLTLNTANVADLLIADASHAHTADTPAPNTQTLLLVADCAHGQQADSIDLASLHLLAVARGVHGHVAEQVTLTSNEEATLTVADAWHGHVADVLNFSSYMAALRLAAAPSHLTLAVEHASALALAAQLSSPATRQIVLRAIIDLEEA